jgi:hypothetical protein
MKKMIYVWAMIMMSFSLVTRAQITQATSNTFSSLQGLSPDRGGVRAAREFWKKYREGKDEKWYKFSGGYLAEFLDEGIETKVVFDKKGNWCYTLRQYTEKELPKDVRALVKSTYYDFSIGWVKEVSQFQSLVYIVHIDNAPEWKDLIVRDGEIEVSHEVTR